MAKSKKAVPTPTTVDELVATAAGAIDALVADATAAPDAPAELTPEEIADRERMDAQRPAIIADLGLDAAETFAAAPVDILDGATELEGDAYAPPSEYALETDEFEQYKGKHLTTSTEYDLHKLGMAPTAVADCFTAAYNPDPQLQKNCVDQYRSDFITALLMTPECQAVREATIGDPEAAEIAACAFAGRLHKYLAENAPDPKNPPPCRTGGRRERDLKAQVDCLKAAAGAAMAAQQGLSQHDEIKQMLGGSEGKMDPKRAAELYKRIKASKKLSRIAELAGRYRRVAASKQRNKTCHGTDDVVGVTVGGNPFKLIPSELASLRHPLLRLETLSKLAEGRALCWDAHGVEPVAKGPIVVVVDESGSMECGTRNADGTVTARVEQAKALALAMAWIAAKQKRFCALVGFSGGTQGTLEILPPGGWNETKIVAWLEHFFGNGTDMDVPMRELPQVYWPKIIAAGAQRGKTDIVIITDGEVNMPKPIEDAFMKWKKDETVKLYSIVINDRAGDLQRVSDTCHLIKGDVLGANSDAVGQVLSI